MNKPTTHQGNLAKLPRALAPLIEREQWAVWRWTQKPDGSWQKPPYIATRPERHASTSDPDTWTDYGTALAAVQAGHADGISYVLTADDPYAAIDLDHCRDSLGGIDIWAQLFLERGRNTYSEITPSGAGCRIWGLASGEKLNRKFDLVIDDKPIAAELFRRTNKALTITGATLDPAVRVLTGVDKMLDWAVIWGERRKAAAAPAEPPDSNGSFNSSGCSFSVEQIEHIVSAGPPAGANRSDLFHAVVGHYLGCGWDVERILTHLEQYPHGIADRYLREGRLAGEITRSARKYGAAVLPLFGNAGWATGWEAKTPPPVIPPPLSPVDPDPLELPGAAPQRQNDPELDNDLDETADPTEPAPDPAKPDPELDDDDLDDELDEPQPNPALPPMYAHGDPDPRPLRNWLVEDLIPETGHGLISGQWGAGKTGVFLELAQAVMTGQPFINIYTVARQSGVLLIAAEGQHDVRPRLEALAREKCGGMLRMPIRWYETVPILLRTGAVENLVAMAHQAEASLVAEFGLPLGLIGIDTLAASAGYSRAGDEQDNAVGQAMMNVAKAVAQKTSCFVFALDHFGKTLDAGTRGASSKEASADVVLACLGDKQLDGAVLNTRVAIRKNRSGPQGQAHSFVLRIVELPQLRKDGRSETSIVVDWTKGSTAAAAVPDDPWLAGCRQEEQRAGMLRLKRVLLSTLAEHGKEQPIPDATPLSLEGELRPRAASSPVVRMIDQEIVREAFHQCSPADPQETVRSRFARARNRAEHQDLIGIGNIDGATHLWLTRPQSEDE